MGEQLVMLDIGSRVDSNCMPVDFLCTLCMVQFLTLRPKKINCLFPVTVPKIIG